MKKTALSIVILLAWAGLSPAQTWEAAVAGGYRTLKDSALREIYGNGFVVAPSLSLAMSKTLRVGAEYEFGYSKNAAIGIPPPSRSAAVIFSFSTASDRDGSVRL